MKNIVLDLTFKDICIIKINRPEVLNALDKDTLLELNDAIEFIKNEDKLRVVIITGEGERSFCSGGDLKYVVSIDPIEAEKFATSIHNILNKIENLDKPVIAAINGYALGGGCQIALACDIRIASCNAKIGQPEVKLGILPGWGGTQRLSRIVGIAQSKELIYTGKIINAYNAKQIGLVNHVVEPDICKENESFSNNNLKNQKKVEEKRQDDKYFKMLKAKLMDDVLNISRQILNNSYDAIRISKSSINKAMDADIETGLQLEIYGNALSFTYPDRLNMMSSFLNKQKIQKT
jgi:3-hydroxypropionyl-coenzyme A dehydratase